MTPTFVQSVQVLLCYSLCSLPMFRIRSYMRPIFHNQLISIPGMKRLYIVPDSGCCVYYGIEHVKFFSCNSRNSPLCKASEMVYWYQKGHTNHLQSHRRVKWRVSSLDTHQGYILPVRGIPICPSIWYHFGVCAVDYTRNVGNIDEFINHGCSMTLQEKHM